MPMNRSQARVIDPILSNVALGFKDPEFIGVNLFPIVDSPASGARIIKFGKEAFLKYLLRRSPGAKTARVQFGYDSDPIALVQDSLEGVVPREWMRDASQVPNIGLGSRAINSVMRIAYRALEIEQSELAQDAAKYDANHKVTLGTAWTDPAADIKADIDAGKAAVRASIGVEPNTLEIPYTAFQGAQNNTKVQAQFKYTSSESISAVMLAAFLGVDKVVVGKGVYAPDEDSDFVEIWTKAVLAYTPVNGQTIEEPSYGYTYVGEGQPLVEQAYWEQPVKSWIYPMEYERRPYITSMNAGYLLDGVQ
ncbi:MAG: hypothetical protein JKX92_12220 [Porticoccaceae bacterium]|nr:hypothetical protein [Porticoccaceae bacterium]